MKLIFCTSAFVGLTAVFVYLVGSMSIYRNTVFYIKGLREFTRSGYETAAKNFNPSDLNVDCSQRHFIVTGANSGIGFSTALELAKKNGTVHLICRNEKTGTEAMKEIIEQSKNDKVHLHLVDMSKPKEILEFTNKFSSSNNHLDVLVNNAGCLLNEKSTTGDGLDANFATNTLGYYLITKGLLELLSKSDDPRVLMVSSGGMYTQKLDYEDFNFDRWSKYDGVTAYSQNKRQQIVMCEEFAKSRSKIFFAAMHPGWSDTPGVRSSIASFYESHKGKFRTAEQGADTLVWLAIAPKEIVGKNGSGKFFQDRTPVSTHLPLAWTRSTEAQNAEFMNKLEKLSSSLKYHE